MTLNKSVDYEKGTQESLMMLVDNLSWLEEEKGRKEEEKSSVSIARLNIDESLAESTKQKNDAMQDWREMMGDEVATLSEDNAVLDEIDKKILIWEEKEKNINDLGVSLEEKKIEYDKLDADIKQISETIKSIDNDILEQRPIYKSAVKGLEYIEKKGINDIGTSR